MNQKSESAFQNNNVSIALSSNNLYVPYLATVIKSIMENSSIKNKYDIFVMHRDITESNQKLFDEMLSDWENGSIHFVNMQSYINDTAFFVGKRLTIETYFRIFLPDILPEYRKVIYLDVDVIVKCDLAELFQTDLEGYLVAATRDCWIVGLCHIPQNDRKLYTDRILNLKDCNNYFQAGVMLFNLEEFRKQLSVEKIMDTVSSYEWRHHDQDVLNVLCDGKVKFVDQAWDIVAENKRLKVIETIQKSPKEISDSYMNGRKNPKIIHYAASEKPWNTPWIDYFHHFWMYARNTPFYEVILCRMMDSKDKALEKRIPNKAETTSVQDTRLASDVVLLQYQHGQLGLRYILKYFKAWLCYKLRRKG